ncbi:flavin-dependent monooxygenase [Actinocorallia aurea]
MPITHDEAVARARDLAPGIAARARETEELRKPHDASIAELVDAELIPILAPKKWGGHELGLDTHRAVVETISAACMSTGWILDFYIGHCVFATKFSERAQAEFFDGKPYLLAPATTSPTTKAVREEGGWRVTGKIPWGSGIMHADWAFCVGFGDDNGLYAFAVPAAEVKVDDVWHMAGMAGTGSNTVVLEDVFVPDHRTLPQRDLTLGDTPGARIHDNPMYRMPLMPFLFAQAAPVFSGALRGAASAFEDVIRNRVTTYGLKTMKDSTTAHVKLGEAATNAMIAERLVADLIARVQSNIGGKFTLAERVGLKAQTAFIVDHCRRAVNDMSHHAGASNFSLDAPLQRFFRDINTIATHAFWDWEVARELQGRHTLDLKPNNPLV